MPRKRHLCRGSPAPIMTLTLICIALKNGKRSGESLSSCLRADALAPRARSKVGGNCDSGSVTLNLIVSVTCLFVCSQGQKSKDCSTRCRMSVSAPAGTRTTCPPCRTISTTNDVVEKVAGFGTSVNTTASFGGYALGRRVHLRTGTPEHLPPHASVVSGIPRCCPNSRSVSRAASAQYPPHLSRSWRCRRSRSTRRSVPPIAFCAIPGLLGEMRMLTRLRSDHQK